MRRSRILSSIALAGLLVLGTACDSGDAETESESSEQQASEQEGQEPAEEQPAEGGEQAAAAAHGEHAGSGAHALVELSAEGTELDPPVQPEQIPDGAWYCDMGTVHYARMEEGDGTCPLCGMRLTHKGAEEQAPE